jgi:hypothetical protein
VCDFNDDGYPDIAAWGQDWGGGGTSGNNHGVYYSDGNGHYAYQDLTSFQLNQGTTSVVDVNNDGKMDIFVTGNAGDNAMPVLLANNGDITPQAPAVPSGLTLTPGGDNALTVSWTEGAATDRYNVYLSRVITASRSVLSAVIPVNITNGKPKVGLDGAALLSKNSLALNGISGGDYTVGVQAIGINGKYSAFTTYTVTVGGSVINPGGGETSVQHGSVTENFVVYNSGSAIVVTTDFDKEASLEVYNLAGTKVWERTGVFAGSTEITGLTKDNLYIVVIRKGAAMDARKVVL